jgi:hypothetical protein
MTIIDSYSESNYDTNLGFDPTTTEYGQAFTGNGLVLNSAVFYLLKHNSPTGNLYANIYALTGTFGTDGKPTGTTLATSDAVAASSIYPEDFRLATFTFSGSQKIPLINGTKYVVTVQHLNSAGANNISVGKDNSYPTHPGNYSFYTGTWSGSGGSIIDICFYVYGDDPFSPILSDSTTITDIANVFKSDSVLNLSDSESVTDSINITLVSSYLKGNFFRIM